MKLRLKTSFIILILLLFAALLCSCDLFKRWERPSHVCSFDDARIVSELSCTTDGIIIRSCMCGRTTTDIRSALGHNYGEWQSVAAPSCAAPGREERACLVCSASQSRNLARTEHSYEISEEISEGTIYNRYTCKVCDESFIIDSGISLPSLATGTKYTFKEKNDFSFVIICTQNEEYVRNNLRIIDYYFEGGEIDSIEIEYNLTPVEGSRWLVEPKDGYENGSTYIAMRSEGVVFEQFGFADLVFSIESEDINKLKLTERLIYIAALNEQSPGYYPYSIEYSSGSGEYFLSLEKADGLSVGDLICVGSATCAEDLMRGSGDNTFGKINYMAVLNDGRSLIMLKKLSYNELFSELDLRESDISSIGVLESKSAVEKKIKEAMLSDADFIALIDAIYEESLVFLERRGLTTEFKTVEELIETIEVTREQICNIYTLPGDKRGYANAEAKIGIKIAVPALIKDVPLGSLTAEIQLSVIINTLSMTVQLLPDEYSDPNVDQGLDFSLDASEETITRFGFDAYADIDYTQTTALYTYDNEAKCYHFKGCKEIGALGQILVSETTVEQLIAKIISPEGVKECPECKPVTSLKENVYILNNENMTYHSYECQDTALIESLDLLYTERSRGILERDGYTKCSVCNGRSNLGEFEEELIKLISDTEIESEANMTFDNLFIGAFETSMTGIDRERFVLSMSLDFKLAESTHYSYEIIRKTNYGYRSTLGGVRQYDLGTSEEIKLNGIKSTEVFSSVNGKSEHSIYLAGFKPKMDDRLFSQEVK